MVMRARLRRRPGFALVEVMIVTLLMGLVFFASATVYTAVLKTLLAVRGTVDRVDAMLAVQSISRRITLANEVRVETVASTGDQLRMRVDYPVDSVLCNNTPKTTTDDTWIKYRFQNNRLYWRWDPPGSPEYDPIVDAGSTPAPQQVAPGLVVANGSMFTLLNPTSTGSATVVNIKILTDVINPVTGAVTETMTCETNVAFGAKSKN